MTPSEKTVAVQQCKRIDYSLSQFGRYLAPIILVTVDYIMVVLAALTVFYFRGMVLPYFISSLPDFSVTVTYVYFILPLTYVVFLAYEGMYVKRFPFWKSVESIFKVCSYASILMIVILYFTYNSDTLSRLFVGLTWVLSFCYLSASRYTTKRIMLHCGLWEKPVIIIGAGKTAEILAKSFINDPGLGYKIVGLIEDNYQNRPLIFQYPYIGTFNEIESAILSSRVQDVMIATPGLERTELLNLIYRVQPYVRNLTIVPDLFGVPLSNMEVETLYNDKTVMLKVRNNLSYLHNKLVKRIFDMILGIIIAFFIIPILFAIGILIKMDSPGPVMHTAKRLGQKGIEFNCYKFRTMYVNGDKMLCQYFSEHPQAKLEWDTYAKLRDYDPRVTKVGKILRKYSLDELPQVFNVLLGNMSLVGPRPYLPREKEKMGYTIHTILETVPGITGFWQVSGRNEIEFDGRLQMDTWYVRNWSFWQDIVILIKTINVVIGRKGAY